MTKKVTKEFSADVAQLIQLVTHSIYSNKDVFLRELVANANDAIQKAQFKAAQDSSYLGDETEMKIRIIADEDKKIITIEDTGVGMSRDEVIEQLWTIAKSWTKAFLEQIKEAKDSPSDLIGQFGIGFYSAFMVASTVEVETKAVGSDAILRTSEGGGSYEIQSSDKTSRGTIIRLHINEEGKDYLTEWKLRSLVHTHANYVPVPIMMRKLEEWKPTDEWEQVNAMKSLRTKNKSEVKDEEYDEHYKSLTYAMDGPFDTLHIAVEWAVTFSAVLYIPKSLPMFGHIDPEQDYGPSLYVRNVLIMDRCKELLPVWLRFVRGVVETPDLSLNVSRELIQGHALLKKIQTTLVKEVLKSLTWKMKESRSEYTDFYATFNRYIKEWTHYDHERKESIAELLLYHSWRKNTLVSFDEYSESLEEKAPIYYLAWAPLGQLKASPYLEQFDGTDTDVLLMEDPIDEYVTQWLRDYKDHPMRSVMHTNTNDNDKESSKEKDKKPTKKQASLLSYLKKILGDTVEEVTVSQRLKNSLAVLVTEEGQSSAQMERIMQSMGQNVPKAKRTLEVNPNHPVAKMLQTAMEVKEQQDRAQKLAQYTYDQAVLLEWGMVDDMAGFLATTNELIAQGDSKNK